MFLRLIRRRLYRERYFRRGREGFLRFTMRRRGTDQQSWFRPTEPESQLSRDNLQPERASAGPSRAPLPAAVQYGGSKLSISTLKAHQLGAWVGRGLHVHCL